MENQVTEIVDKFLLAPAFRLARLVMGPKNTLKMIDVAETAATMAALASIPVAGAAATFLVGEANKATVTTHPFLSVAVGVVAAASFVTTACISPKGYNILDELTDRTSRFNHRLRHAFFNSFTP